MCIFNVELLVLNNDNFTSSYRTNRVTANDDDVDMMSMTMIDNNREVKINRIFRFFTSFCCHSKLSALQFTRIGMNKYGVCDERWRWYIFIFAHQAAAAPV